MLSTHSPLVRRRISVVALGTLTAFLLPAVLMGASGLLGGSIPVNGASFTGFLFPVCIAYAIVKQDLFEIDVMLRRVITYAALGLIVVTACTLALLGLRAVLPEREALLSSPVVLAALNLALVALVVLLRSRVQRLVDRVLFPASYDAQLSLATLSRDLTSEPSVEGVIGHATHLIDETVAPTMTLLSSSATAAPSFPSTRNPARPRSPSCPRILSPD